MLSEVKYRFKLRFFRSIKYELEKLKNFQKPLESFSINFHQFIEFSSIYLDFKQLHSSVAK